jgi:hypothetical protein
LIASTAIIEPITPVRAPTTPTAAQVSASGGAAPTRAAVAGAAREDADLSRPATHGAGDQRPALGDAGGVDSEADGEVVRAVEHEVVAADQRGRILVQSRDGVGLDLHVRVQRGEPFGRTLDLRGAHVRGGVEDLPLEVERDTTSGSASPITPTPAAAR